jgi:hypothetical protein
MFIQKSIWPLKTMMDMPKKCKICNQQMELETGFYFGTGYVSYALSVAFLISFFVAYHVLFGLSVYDNSLLICLFSGIAALVLCQPLMMRLSRSLYLSVFVPHNSDWKTQQDDRK